MDIQENLRGIFGTIIEPGGTITHHWLGTNHYEFAQHAGHKDLGVCLVTRNQESTTLWLFGISDDLPDRYRELAENEYCEQSTEILYSLRYDAPRNELWEKTALSEKWAESDWVPAYLRAKAYLSLKLADLIESCLGIFLNSRQVSTARRCECGAEATWVRRTQFSGNHPFCDKHAREEENFGKSDSSYFVWEPLAQKGSGPAAIT